MDQINIEGVKLSPLKKIEDERGKLLHIIRNDSDVFEKFGEVYISITNPGVVKGWKLHKEMVQNFAVPSGKMKIVLSDKREGSPSFGKVDEFVLSIDNYYLLTIPNNVWYSFKAISEEPAMIVNCASLTHNPEESIVESLESDSFNYKWN